MNPKHIDLLILIRTVESLTGIAFCEMYATEYQENACLNRRFFRYMDQGLCDFPVTFKLTGVMTLIAALLVLELVFATTSFIAKHHGKQ